MPNSYAVVICSKNKNGEGDKKMPAVDLYDGPTFEILREESLNCETMDRWLRILSPKYKLIKPCAPISDYDQKMTQGRAAAIRAEVTEELLGLLNGPDEPSMLLFPSNLYKDAIGAELLHHPRVTDFGFVSYAGYGVTPARTAFIQWCRS